MVASRKALFLDRDGVINESTPRGVYVTNRENFTLKPNMRDIVAKAKEAGYLVIVVTNQPHIGRRIMTVAQLNDLHDIMRRYLGGVDAIYYCPHIDEDDCDCRKPRPGMLLKAIAGHDIDAGRSIMVGDSPKDIQAGQAAGCGTTLFIRHVHNHGEEAVCPATATLDDISEIASYLM